MRDIAAAFPVTKPTISQHLAVLREAGLAESTAVGTSRRYRARRDALGSAALGSVALGSAGKWTNADDDPQAPDRASSRVRTQPVVVASTDVDTSQAVTFAAFTDPVVYSRWLGVPVTLTGGRFACTMEWGTNVRGRYELVCPPELIVMRWDFEDDHVPVPGGEMTGYLRIQPHEHGSHVEVHQLVDTPPRPRSWRGPGPWSSVGSRPGSPAPQTRARPWRPAPAGPSSGRMASAEYRFQAEERTAAHALSYAKPTSSRSAGLSAVDRLIMPRGVV